MNFFETVKTHKFDTTENSDVKYLKRRPIIDQTGYIYIYIY